MHVIFMIFVTDLRYDLVRKWLTGYLLQRASLLLYQFVLVLCSSDVRRPGIDGALK